PQRQHAQHEAGDGLAAQADDRGRLGHGAVIVGTSWAAFGVRRGIAALALFFPLSGVRRGINALTLLLVRRERRSKKEPKRWWPAALQRLSHRAGDGYPTAHARPRFASAGAERCRPSSRVSKSAPTGPPSSPSRRSTSGGWSGTRS